MKRRPMQSHRQQGLTLVELLLALAITAMLMAPLAAIFQGASGSAVTARAGLDLNADARFVLDRIARGAAALGPVSSGATVTDVSPWLAPLSYRVVGTDLVETDTSAKPPRTSIVASNVDSFQLSVPEVGDGQVLLQIDLTLKAEGNSVSASRLVRVGAPF